MLLWHNRSLVIVKVHSALCDNCDILSLVILSCQGFGDQSLYRQGLCDYMVLSQSVDYVEIPSQKYLKSSQEY